MNTYTVRAGDTLSIIAREQLGDIARWPELADVNGITSPYTIFPGQVLKLPAPIGSSGGAGSALVPFPAAASAAARPAASPFMALVDRLAPVAPFVAVAALVGLLYLGTRRAKRGKKKRARGKAGRRPGKSKRR